VGSRYLFIVQTIISYVFQTRREKFKTNAKDEIKILPSNGNTMGTILLTLLDAVITFWKPPEVSK